MSELEVLMYAVSGVLTAVPEPGSGVLVGLGLLRAVASRRKRRA